MNVIFASQISEAHMKSAYCINKKVKFYVIS